MPPFCIEAKYSLYLFSCTCCSFCNFLSKPLLISFPSASCVGKPYIEMSTKYVKQEDLYNIIQVL